MRQAAGAAVAAPTLAAILAACSKPTPVSNSSSGGSGGPYDLSRPDHPVTLPMHGEPASSTAPLEDATLQIYNWDSYMWKAALADWETASQHKYEYTTFNNMSEAEAKLSAGQVAPDVFFPTIDILARSVAGGLLQPLNHDLIPNIKDDWPQFSTTAKEPFYDVGWRYTVPYVIYTTGIAYRRDQISEAEITAKGYDIFWDPKYKGKVGIYDDYREALGMAMMRKGVTDINTSDPAVINQARDDLLELVDLVNVQTTINGAYRGIPEGQFWVHQAWSGDMCASQYYLPKGVSTDVLGFYKPDVFPVGNDTLAIPATAKSPVLAHNFINYWISDGPAFKNFTWNGYQPPLNSLDPTKLVPKYVPESVSEAVVMPSDFDNGLWFLELAPTVDDLWQSAWDDFNSGAK
jgi:spermidine/putrescine transport system substrate-binding protein